MRKAFYDSMKPYFLKDSPERALLSGKRIVLKLCSAPIEVSTSDGDDPFISFLDEQDKSVPPRVIDGTLNSSFWHVSTHRLTPWRGTFTRAQLDVDREEPKFAENELKIKV